MIIKGVLLMYLFSAILNCLLAYYEYKKSENYDANKLLEEISDPTWCYWDGF